MAFDGVVEELGRGHYGLALFAKKEPFEDEEYADPRQNGADIFD